MTSDLDHAVRRTPFERIHAKLARIESVTDLNEVLNTTLPAAIRKRDVPSLLMIAEEAIRWRQWQACAQVLSYTLIDLFRGRWDDAQLVRTANEAIILSHRPEPRFSSVEDVALYCFRRALGALRKEGLDERRQVSWMAEALAHIASQSADEAAPLTTAESHFRPTNPSISVSEYAYVGRARAVLVKTADFGPERTSSGKSNVPAFLATTLVMVGLAGAIGASWIARGVVEFPMSSTFFQGTNWLGAALLLWPALLAATWFLAYAVARSTDTVHCIAPRHLLRRTPSPPRRDGDDSDDCRVTSGEIMPFARDTFYHIFQFIWMPFLLIAVVMMSKYEQMPASLSSMVANAAVPSTRFEGLAPSVIPSLTPFQSVSESVRAMLSSELLALVAAAIAAAYSVLKQTRIQRDRARTGSNMYWWDRRISLLEWRVRLFMVGVNMALGAFLLIKLSAIVLVAYQVASAPEFPVRYFAPDGIGGFGPILEILKILVWLVFLFGVFVIASTYMHWNLPEYRRSDTGLLVAYLVFVVLAVTPLLILEFRLQATRELLLAAIPVLTSDPIAENLPTTANRIRDINEIRNWTVSAFSLDLLKSPIVPLVGQLIFAIVQFIIRMSGGQPLLFSRQAQTDGSQS